MRRTVTEYIEIRFAGVRDEVEADVSFHFDPSSRGFRERATGAPLEPDTAAEVIVTAVVVNGTNILAALPRAIVIKLEKQILANELEGSYV